ncbi:hypothetical protein [Thalassotalea maritima]|uniref:hypothetical protein n=1 Tax=Thalassotalea maritima TaxID=3242416 RepID=UPI0035286F0F
MLTLVFVFFILCHLTMLSVSSKANSNQFTTWWLRILLCGVLYDNIVVMLSSIYGADERLSIMHQMRWYLHSLILPFLTVFTYKMLEHAGYQGVRSTWCKLLFVLVTVISLGYGIWHEILNLELTTRMVSTPLGDIERFVAVSKAPPFATIGTNLFAIIWSVVIWKKARWPWMFAGSLTIFLINGASVASPYGFLFGNMAEVVFIASLLATAIHFTPKQRTPLTTSSYQQTARQK